MGEEALFSRVWRVEDAESSLRSALCLRAQPGNGAIELSTRSAATRALAWNSIRTSKGLVGVSKTSMDEIHVLSIKKFGAKLPRRFRHCVARALGSRGAATARETAIATINQSTWSPEKSSDSAKVVRVHGFVSIQWFVRKTATPASVLERWIKQARESQDSRHHRPLIFEIEWGFLWPEGRPSGVQLTLHWLVPRLDCDIVFNAPLAAVRGAPHGARPSPPTSLPTELPQRQRLPLEERREYRQSPGQGDSNAGSTCSPVDHSGVSSPGEDDSVCVTDDDLGSGCCTSSTASLSTAAFSAQRGTATPMSVHFADTESDMGASSPPSPERSSSFLRRFATSEHPYLGTRSNFINQAPNPLPDPPPKGHPSASIGDIMPWTYTQEVDSWYRYDEATRTKQWFPKHDCLP